MKTNNLGFVIIAGSHRKSARKKSELLFFHNLCFPFLVAL